MNRENDDELKTIISSLAKKIEKNSHKEDLLPQKVENDPLPYCPLPTDMCRVSPFFPLSKKELKKRDFIEEEVIVTSSWGQITYTGPKLSVYEEDALIAILTVFDKKIKNNYKIIDDKKTYVYKGSILPFLRLYTKGRNPSSKDYTSFLKKINLLASTNIQIITYYQSTDEKKKRKIEGFNLIVHYFWDDVNKKIEIELNPYFYDIYMRKNYTLLDLNIRFKLKKPVSKALYRFIKSHKGKVWKGHYITLAKALNLDTSQDTSKKAIYIKINIQNAIKELKSHNVLSKRSGFLRKSPDIVMLVLV